VEFEIGRRLRLAMRSKVSRGDDGHDRRLGDLPRNEAGIGQFAVVDADIEAFRDQVDQAVGHDQFDGHRRISGEELGEARHDIEPTEDRRHGGAHQAGGRDQAAPDAGLGGFDIAHDAHSGFGEVAAGLGEGQTARGPLQSRTRTGLATTEDTS
jgi:hypothetical protein